MSGALFCLDSYGRFRPPVFRAMARSRTTTRRQTMAEERKAQVALTARELRWLLEQIGAALDPDARPEGVREQIEDQLEQALFELEERE